MGNLNSIKYLKTKIAKATLDFSAQRAVVSSLIFDAADISDALDTITIANHPYTTGDHVCLVLTAATGVAPTVPAAATNYYVIVVDKNTIALATSLALAKAGTKTALTGAPGVDAYLQKDCFGLVGTGLVIPNGAIVTEVFYDVITTCVSDLGAWGVGLDDGTMSMGLNSAVDLLAAISIKTSGATGVDVFDAGRHGTLCGFGTLGADAAHDTQVLLAAVQSASYIKMTADRELTVTIAAEPFSIGKIDIYVKYMI